VFPNKFHGLDAIPSANQQRCTFSASTTITEQENVSLPFVLALQSQCPVTEQTLHISTAIEQEVTDYHHLMEFLLRTFFANKTSTQILKDLSNTFTDLVRFPRTFKGPRIFKVN